MNIIPATPGTLVTTAEGETLSVIGWGFDEEGNDALTIRGSMRLHPRTIRQIKHADGRIETI